MMIILGNWLGQDPGNKQSSIQPRPLLVGDSVGGEAQNIGDHGVSLSMNWESPSEATSITWAFSIMHIYIYTLYIWVCLKMGYTPNYSHLVGIMISKTIGCRGTLFSDKPIYIYIIYIHYIYIYTLYIYIYVSYYNYNPIKSPFNHRQHSPKISQHPTMPRSWQELFIEEPHALR